MLKAFVSLALCLTAAAALAQDGGIGNETPSAESAVERPASREADADAAAAQAKSDAFTPPPGFATKKRGALTLYCRRDRETGTRFTTEKCYDEAQVREYLLTLEQQKRDIDRIRSTCATAAVCSKT